MQQHDGAAYINRIVTCVTECSKKTSHAVKPGTVLLPIQLVHKCVCWMLCDGVEWEREKGREGERERGRERERGVEGERA